MKHVLKTMVASLLSVAAIITVTACSSSSAPTEEEETYTVGMGVSFTTQDSTDGAANLFSTFASVVTDEDGKIVTCSIDAANNSIPLKGGLVAGADRTTVFKTSQQKYVMFQEKSDTSAWCTQANAFAESLLGKTADDICALTADDETTAELIKAVQKACASENSKTFQASSYKMGIYAVSSVNDNHTLDASDDSNGVLVVDTVFTTVIRGDKGKLISAIFDYSDASLCYDINGSIGETMYNGTYCENLPSFSEWGNDVNAFLDTLIGLSQDEIQALTTLSDGSTALSESAPSDSALTYSNYQNAVAKAIGYVK